MSRESRPPHRSFGRLSLESLEAREVPAVNIWQGTSDDFSNAAYWTDGIPTADDILVLSGTPVQPPSPPPPAGPPEPNPLPVTPPSPTNSNVSLTFPNSGGANYLSSYAGIRILNGYGGTVTFPANVGFAEWTQNSGATSQAAGNTITVTSTFGWIGGAINTSSNAAMMVLSGVTNGQIGEDTTSLSSGSKFVFEGLTEVSQAGTLTLLNDGSNVEVAENAVLNQRRINFQNAAQPVIQANANWETTDTGGVIASGSFYPLDGKVKFVRVGPGGTLDIDTDPRGGLAGLTVTGKTSGGFGVRSFGWVMIRNGLTLTAAHGVRIAGTTGRLTTFTDAAPTLQIATIDGRLRFEGYEINLGMGGTDPKGVLHTQGYSTLVVKKEVELWGGAFFPKISTTVVTDRDAIETDKTLGIADFTISPLSEHVQPATVLVSADGFVDNTDPINPNNNLWTMARSGDGKSFTVKKA